MNTRFTFFLIAAISFSVLLATPTRAVIVYGGDGTQNTSAPADDPGWANAGIRGGATGVYLGHHWVLTAAHVGIGSIVLNGISYGAVSGSSIRLKNPDNTDADLLLFQISGDPQLPALTVSSTTPANNSTVTMIGYGRNRAAEPTLWDASWNEDPSGTREGYKWAAGQTMRWGQNTIVNNTHSFQTRFSASPNNAQAATGDSGGAVFFKNGETWELAGIIHSISLFSGQPSSTSVYKYPLFPAVMGTDGQRTYIADLSVYRDQIIAVVPEPSTWAMLLMGAAALLLRVLRRTGRGVR
jgi:hypothetical protein